MAGSIERAKISVDLLVVSAHVFLASSADNDLICGRAAWGNIATRIVASKVRFACTPLTWHVHLTAGAHLGGNIVN